MDRTTSCMPCVPSILEGFRRGATPTTSAGLDGRGGSGRNGTDGGCGDGGGTEENEAEYLPNKPTARPKMNTSATKQTDGSELPSVTRISTVGPNANRTHSLQKGKTSFGSAVDQDVVIEGVGIDNQHCYLINEGQVVTFYPLAVFNSVDGFRVTKPTKLYHGSVLCFGQSVYFRFNFPPPPKIILIKGSSPGDESRRKLIKLQSKPGAQEVNVTKSSFPVPDASQFYWVDFDKELGLKPPAPIELTPSNAVGRLTDAYNVPQSDACNVRHVRNSLPSSSSSSHPWSGRPYRVRFPSQDLEVYPKEKSECSSPPSTTFPSSPPNFSQNGAARDVGRFQRPSVNAKECRRLDDKSSPVVTRLAEISPSSSSQNGGVTSSLVSRLCLNPFIRDDGEPCKTGPRVFHNEITCASNESSYPAISTVASPSSGTNSALHLNSSTYDDYDNIDDMEAAAMVYAAARLANPPSAAVRNLHILSNGSKSLQPSVVSESGSLSHVAPQMIQKSSISLEPGDRVCDPSIGSMGVNPQDQLSNSSSEICTKELIDREFSAASDFGAKSTDCNWQTSDFEEVLCEHLLSSASICESISEVSSASEESADVTVASSKHLDSVVTDLNSTSKLDNTFGSIESSNSVEENNELSSEQCEDMLFLKAELSIREGKNPVESTSEFPLARECSGIGICPEEPPSVKPDVDTVSRKPDVDAVSIKASEFGIKKPENLSFLMTESGITEERNSANLIIKSPFVEECGRTNVVCSNKPPIGKPVPPESTKSRKSMELSDKKLPESATASLFKSLLGRSWSSPLEKGRADHPTSSSSTNELKDHHANQTSRLQREAVKAVHHSDPGILARDFGERLKAGVEDGDISNLAEADNTSGGSLPDEIPALSQNPWRFNLRDSLKLNLENFKGEKVFTKDTVTTNVFIGDGLDRFRVYPATPVSSRESHSKGCERVRGYDAKATKVALSSGISSSDQDLRSIAPLEPRTHSSVDYGYMSDSGISVVEDAGRVVRFCRPRGKKSVTFAEECRVGSLAPVLRGSQPLCATSQAVSQDMNHVAAGRSPTEKTSISENFRTYLEVVDSSCQRRKAADNAADHSGKDLTNGTKIQNGILNLEAKDVSKLKSNVIDSNKLSYSSSVLNTGSQNGSDVEPHDVGKVKGVDEKQSVDFDDFGLNDFGESQRDLKRLYEQQRASRLEDQRRAELEKIRLQEILKICSEIEKAKNREHNKSNTAYCCKSSNSGTSNSKDVVEQSLFALLHSKECSSSLRDRRPSEPHQPSLDRVHQKGRRPSDEHRSTSRNTSHRGLANGNSKGLQLDWLPELQRDTKTGCDMKQKISVPGKIQRKSARGEDVEKIRLGREKLFDMEQRLKAIEELISRSTNADEAEALKQRCSEMQKACHHLRFLIDNLEFQQLEVEARFEDEKELISKELTSQHAYLSSLSNQHQNRWPSSRVPEGEVRAISQSLRFSRQKNPAKFSHTIPKVDSQRIHPSGEAYYNEEARLSRELRKQSSPSWPVWERSRDPPDEGGVANGALVQRQGPRSTAPTGSEDSSVAGSDSLSEKTLSLSSKEDQFQDVERLLALAQAKGLRLVEEEQVHQCDVEKEALEQERRCRKELERRLAEEISKNSGVVGQAIKLREKERLQARPLTRYLPVHDDSLDLRQFVVAAGHSVDRCTHLAVTSTSCHGYLMKMGGRIRTWKKRWFVFDRAKRCLSYYGDKSESRPRGVAYFQSIEDVFVDHLHQVKSPTPQLTFCVKTSSRMYYLLASSPDSMRIWIDVIFTGAEGYQQFA